MTRSCKESIARHHRVLASGSAETDLLLLLDFAAVELPTGGLRAALLGTLFGHEAFDVREQIAWRGCDGQTSDHSSLATK